LTVSRTRSLPHADRADPVPRTAPGARSGCRGLGRVAVLAACLFGPLAGTGLADEIKMGMWISNLEAQEIIDGQLLYTTSGGAEVTRPIQEVEGIRLDAYPRTRQIEAKIEAGELEAAARLLDQELEATRPDWVHLWLTYRAWQVAAMGDDPVAAMEAWFDLASREAARTFLPDLPVVLLAEATGDQKAQVRHRLESFPRAVRRARGVSEKIDELRELIGAAEGASAEKIQERVAEAREKKAIEEGRAPEGEAAIAFLSRMEMSDPITRMLYRGEFEEAEARAEEELSGYTGGRMSELLYQLGLAQLGQALARNDKKRYKDAGLSFMRVLAYFPNSPYAGHAQMEVGRVHAVIGEKEKARELYNQAENELDPEEDAHLIEQLRQLQQEAAPSRGG